MKSFFKKLYAGLKKYISIMRITSATRLTYRIDQLSEILFVLIILTVLFFFHRVALATATVAQSEGLTLVQVMWIVFFVNVFASERRKGVSQQLNEEIHSGQIAYQLNRPYSYILFHLAQYLGDKIPSLLSIGALCGAVLYYVVGCPPVSMKSLAIGILMLLIGLIINFFMQFCIGLCAFWIGNVDPLRWIYKQLQSLAGGAVIPIAFFPPAVKKVMLYLPFSHIAYGAARLIVDFEHVDVWFYLRMELVWLLIIILGARALFARGIKNVVVGGG
jgi:ABC-2 type transport system permease protein